MGLVQTLKRRFSNLTLFQIFKLYGVFALLNSLYKVFKFYVLTQRKLRSIRHLPGKDIDLTARDFLANLNRLHEWRRDFLLKYPGAGLVKTAAPEVEVMCNTPETVECMLKTNFGKVTKPGALDDYTFLLLGEFLGDEGIFTLRHSGGPRMASHESIDTTSTDQNKSRLTSRATSSFLESDDSKELSKEHALWYSQRKAASKIFTKNQFNGFMSEVFCKKIDILVDTITQVATKNEPGVNKVSEGASAMDIQEKFFCFTFDSIQKIFFNRTVDTVSGKQDEYAAAFDDAHRAMLRHMFAIAPIQILSGYLPYPFGSLFNPARSALFNPMFAAFCSIDPHYKDFRRNIDILDKYTYEMVRETRTTPVSERNDLLALFMKADPNLTDKQLRDVILNFIIAGRDTSACTLTWLFYELTQNLAVQEKLFAEVNSVLKSRKVTPEDVTAEKMPYLTGVMMETLRLHPPVPEDAKFATEDVTFPDGTTITKGTKLTFSPYSLGRDPLIYENPLEFNPERWYKDGVFQEPCMYRMPTFQAGPRFCLGKDMAKLEIKMVTASLSQHFRFELEGNESPDNITYAMMITMSLSNNKTQTSHNLWVVPHLR